MIRIKPHHFIDIITSYGGGTETFVPHPLGHAVHTVAEEILSDRNAMVVMDLGADDICAPCSKNNDGVCEDTIDTSYRPDAPESKRKWNLIIDRRWCERLGIEEGDRFSAREYVARVRDRMGDITDIYREIPAEMTAERAEKLRQGIEKYLGGD